MGRGDRKKEGSNLRMMERATKDIAIKLIVKSLIFFGPILVLLVIVCFFIIFTG